MNMKEITTLQTIFFALLIISPLLFNGMINREADDGQPFQLNNYSMFQPGDDASVTIYGPGEYKEFYFRLLRITEPLLFVKTYIANGSYYQFDIWLSAKASMLDYVEVAKEWEAEIERGDYWEAKDVKIGEIEEAGYYVLQAFSKNQVAYCPVIVSNYALVYKSAGKDLLAHMTDISSGAFIPNAEYFLMNNDTLLQSKRADNDGFAFFKNGIPTDNYNNFYFYTKTEDEILFNNPNVLYGYDYGEKYTAYIYTNQPIYRPGGTVKFNAILRQKSDVDFMPVKGDAIITIKSEKNTEVYNSTIAIDEYGTVAGEFTLDDEADLGNYTIYITADGKSFSGTFKVEEYKKPEYKVTVTTDKQQYTKDGKLKGTVQADYYFGSPVAEGDVLISIYKKQLWFPWWWFSDYAWFYRGFDTEYMYYYGGPQLIATYDGKLNKDGSFEFEHPINETGEGDFSYQITASVTDASRRSIDGSASAYVTRGEFSMSVSSTRYFVTVGGTTEIKVNTFDFSMKPVPGIPIMLTIVQSRYDRDFNLSSDTLETIELTTNEAGKTNYMFRPKEEGSYRIIAKAVDSNGNTITAENSFYVWEDNFGYYSYSGGGVDIVTDKEVYNIGDTLTAVIFMPVEAEEVALTLMKNEFLSFEKITAGGKVFEIKKVLGPEHIPSFNINASFVKDGQMYDNSKLIGVMNTERFLNVEITPVKEVFKPGELSKYTIKVTDNDGNPVKGAAFSFGSVDESIYAIQEEITKDIQTFFYSPQTYYSPTYFSVTQSNFSGYSRFATRYDQFYDGSKSELEKGTASVTGSVEITNKDELYFELSECKVAVFSKNGFKISKLDTSGNFSLDELPEGTYDLCVISPANTITFIKVIELKEYDRRKEEIETEMYDYYYSPGFDGFGERNVDMLMVEDAPAPTVGDEEVKSKGRMKKEDEGMVEPTVRKNFQDAAYWTPQVITDANGEATVEFNLPDNLTSWRSTVRAFTKNTMVGQNTNIVIARKDLLLRTETPRFFREGDRLVVSTMIHNYLDTEKETKITFKAENLTLIKGSVSNDPAIMIDVNDNSGGVTVEIGSNDELRIDWLVEVVDPLGEAKLYCEALTNEESDAMELKVPILPYGIQKRIPLNTVVKGTDESETIAFTIPEDIDLRTVSLSFAVNPTIGTTLLKSLDDLIGYPYGCVEQTMSRFLPAIIVANTFESLDLDFGKTETAEKLPDVIDKGMKRLYSFQHSDGGWGWWKNDNSNPYMTAYVLYGLKLAADAGNTIDQNAINNGVYFLNQQLKNRDDIDETTLAYLTYVYTVSSREDAVDQELVMEIITDLFDEDLNGYAQALIGLTAHYLGYAEVTGKVTEALINNAVVDDFSTYWGGEAWHYNWQDDKVQTTAYVIKYLLAVGKGYELIEKAVPWLLRQQKGFSWHSTQQTAVVIFALTDYLLYTNELNPDYTAAILLNGEPVFEKRFTPNNVMEEGKSLKFDALSSELLKNGKNEITIQKQGAGSLYFTGLETHFSTNINEPADSKFAIEREYFKLVPKQTPDGIMYEKKPVTDLVSGEDVFVKVRVDMESEEMQYFMIEEMLPSGFEVVKDDHLYRIEDENNYNNYYYDYYYMPWRWSYADKEVRDEKISFFVTYPTGSMEFTYIMKAQIPGKYTVMPAEASLMYYPEIYGTSLPYKIDVKDR